jgi:hypothetical protein
MAMEPGIAALIDQLMSQAEAELNALTETFCMQLASEGESQAIANTACFLLRQRETRVMGMLVAALKQRAESRDRDAGKR